MPTGPLALIRTTLAVAIIGGPLGYLVGGALSPSVHASGSSSIAAAATANPTTNAIHLVAFVLATFLLPVAVVGLAWLAYPRAPWLATIGGLLGVIGWLPFSALTALDDLINATGGDQRDASLLDRFSTDAVMSTYLVVYIVCHLAAYVVLGVALRTVVPTWAAWCLIASSPLTVAAFVAPAAATLITGSVALTMLLVGSIPAAARVLGQRPASR
jgi:hypothetical protein